MGFNNPDVPWSEIERRLSDRQGSSQQRRSGGRAEEWWQHDPLARRHRESAHPGDGGDSPAWSRRREEYRPPTDRPGADPRPVGDESRVAYAELHCHSAFSFLDGVSQPEALAEEADRLGLEALAITDHHGFYGVVFAVM